MRLKSYFAGTVEAAVGLARQEMGEDAMLVSSRKTLPEARRLGLYEVVFAASPEPLREAPHQIQQPTPELAMEVAEMRRQIAKVSAQVSRSAHRPRRPTNPALDDLEETLDAQQVDGDLAGSVLRRLEELSPDSTAIEVRKAFRQDIESRIAVSAELPGGIVVLVGPPGVGKTTVLAKLAVRFGVLSRRSTHIISYDGHRIASGEQLRTYAAILGIGFEGLYTIDGLARSLKENVRKDLILIDTPGYSASDFEFSSELSRFLSTYPHLDIHLVLSCAAKTSDLSCMVERYKTFHPAKLLFTKLDETASYGAILNEPARTGLPVSFFSTGPRVPDDFELATKDRITDLLGGGPRSAGHGKRMKHNRGMPATAGVGGSGGRMSAYNNTSMISSDVRDRLILDNLPQVRLIARRIHERLPESVSLDDLISTGVVGLITAVDNFDPAQNVKLKTYAEYKIRGAILDSLRGLDWAPRQKRKKAKQIEAAISAAEQRLHKAPNEEEVAAELDLTLDEYHGWLLEIRGVNIGSFEYAKGEEEGRDLLQFISDDENDWPSNLFERAELQKLLASAIERMPEVERKVLGLYYHNELTLREIAAAMTLHESRVSQLKSQAILRLRTYMERRWPTQRGVRNGV